MTYWVIIIAGILALASQRFWSSSQVSMRANDSAIRSINLKQAMTVIISLAVLASSLYIILSQKFDDASQKWAFGSIGTVIGF